VIPCGVDLDRFRPDSSSRPTDDGPRIVSVGRLVPRKGFDLLIRALRAIPDAELVIAGGPAGGGPLDRDPEAKRLRALARRLKVRDRVRLIGAVNRDDMPDLLRSADVVACAPWYEPFGLVPLEAMACGVPVVATAVGGITDTIVDEVTGLLVPPYQPAALTHALGRVLTDPVLRDSLGVAGADRAQSRYSWHRVAADTMRVYESVVAEGSHAAAAAQ
jgi:glycosyltransferase involved in cell wall biosynthesis